MGTSFGAQHLRFLLLFICFQNHSNTGYLAFSIRQDSDGIKFGKVKTMWFDKCAWIIQKNDTQFFAAFLVYCITEIASQEKISRLMEF